MQNFGGQIWCIMGNVRVAYSPQTGMDPGGGCRGAHPPAPPQRDDLRLSNATGILQKQNINYVIDWC